MLSCVVSYFLHWGSLSKKSWFKFWAKWLHCKKKQKKNNIVFSSAPVEVYVNFRGGNILVEISHFLKVLGA